jgi:cytochrome c oxidase assembly factor 4
MRGEVKFFTLRMAEEEEDEYILRIKRTGCYEQHIKLLECHFDTKDFRKCITQMQDFRDCFAKATITESISPACKNT